MREFTEVTFYRPPLRSEEGGPLLPSAIPKDLVLPHVIGRPITGRSAGTGTLKRCHQSVCYHLCGRGSEPNSPLAPPPEQEPIDIYIRPLLLKAGWIKRKTGKGEKRLQFRELVAAGLNGVPDEATVAGPCFLAAKLCKDTVYFQRKKHAVVCFRTKKANWAANKNFFSYTFDFFGQY